MIACLFVPQRDDDISLYVNCKKRLKYERAYIESVHQNSSNNKKELTAAKECGCFYCCQIFNAAEIEEWMEGVDGPTAICPKCDIDAVLSDNHPIKDIEFLKQMHSFWF